MKKFYLLYHAYDFADGKEIKHLGLYSSTENAEKARQRYIKLAGFSEYPENCFYICEFAPDNDEYWKDGFVNTDRISEDFRNLTITLNKMADIKETPETSWKNQDYYYVLCEISALRYRTDDIQEIAGYIRKLFRDYMETELNPHLCTRTAEKILR
ncbi:MAG: hypothetical protein K2J40_11125 [Ruminococcus sp.]|nr:hypothetical protein [Ruminococcus sp.]